VPSLRPARFVVPLLMVSLVFLTACGGGGTLVFGAASLADALEAVGAAWTAEHPTGAGPTGRGVAFNFAGSNDLARQIAAGAPAELFVSADRSQLEAAQRAVMGEAVALLSNALVVIAPAGSGAEGVRVESARDLLAFDRLALPDPEAVPAGVYARRWLEAEGIWEELRDRVVPALDVRANLAAVASGGVPVGIVYATDAAVSDRVEVLLRVPGPPAGKGPEIVYWAAPVEPVSAEAERFLAYLTSGDAGEIFRRFGFEHLPSLPKPPGGARAGAEEEH